MLRFAPSPTRDMSIIDMRIALINYIISRQQNEQFVVRMEDTDKDQTIEGKDQEILDLLKRFAIEQEQLFYQSDVLGRHQQFALSLVEQSKAFVCICPDGSHDPCSCLHNRESIATRIKTENLTYVIRIIKPHDSITFIDKIQGEIYTDPNNIGDFIILQAEGTPSYDFACACDDMLTNITTVIRDITYISHTPRQIHIKRSLGYTANTAYAHLPAIEHPDKHKLSIKWLLSEGFLLDTIINYLLSTGQTTPTEIFTLPDAIAWFDLESLSKTPIPFDIDRLRSLNREHLRAMEDIALSKIFGFADADIGKLLKLHLSEASTINALDAKIQTIFSPKSCPGEWANQMQTIAASIQKAPMIHEFHDFKQYIMEQTKLQGENLSKPLQLLMTGTQNSPALDDIYPLIKPYITEIARCTPC